MKPPAVAILGAGPAGLLAAHACKNLGLEFSIFSQTSHHTGKLKKSQIAGAQYLHQSIPGLAEQPDGTLTYWYVGTKEGYATKVYKDPAAPCSWQRFPRMVNFWTMQSVYDRLWTGYADHAHLADLDWLAVQDLLGMYDMVVSSVPLMALCQHPDKWQWRMEDVWILPHSYTSRNQIVYNGLDDDEWYRTSNINGYEFTEYGFEYESVDGHHKVTKPLFTDCEEWPEVLKVGRYGKWAKEELVHDAYYDTERACRERGLVPARRKGAP